MSGDIDLDFIRAATGGIDQAQPFGAGKEPGEQGTIEWALQRMGKVTCSRFVDVCDFTKAGKPSAKRTTYLWEVLSERITGELTQRFVNAAMEWGTTHEGDARMRYEAERGAFVTTAGLINHPTIPMCAGSVDGLVDDEGIIEIKCPTTPTHLKTILSGECEYMEQIQGYLWLTGRQWADYISYDPRPKSAGTQFYVQRVERDAEFIGNLEIQVIAFLAEVADLEARIRAKG